MEIDFTKETVGAYISRVLPTTKVTDLSNKQLELIACLVDEAAARDQNEADALRRRVKQRAN